MRPRNQRGEERLVLRRAVGLLEELLLKDLGSRGECSARFGLDDRTRKGWCGFPEPGIPRYLALRSPQEPFEHPLTARAGAPLPAEATIRRPIGIIGHAIGVPSAPQDVFTTVLGLVGLIGLAGTFMVRKRTARAARQPSNTIACRSAVATARLTGKGS